MVYDESGMEKAAAICIAYLVYKSKAPLQVIFIIAAIVLLIRIRLFLI